MMRVLPDDVKVYLRVEPTDMRKAIGTLSVLIAEVLEMDPGSGHLFMFRNRKGDKIKALYYERNAFTLWYRRLEKGKYLFPKDAEGVIELDDAHLQWLFNSDKYTYLSTKEKKVYEDFY